MKYIIIALLFTACVTSPEYTFQNVEEFTGYIANGHNEPVVFSTPDTSIFVYDYQIREAFNDRVDRTIYVKEIDGKYHFVSELRF